MNTLEIVHLRSSGKSLDTLCDLIRESIWERRQGAEVVTLYRRQGLETDIAVHLRHDGAGKLDGPSALALHLARALRSFGLVEHTVWEEIG